MPYLTAQRCPRCGGLVVTDRDGEPDRCMNCARPMTQWKPLPYRIGHKDPWELRLGNIPSPETWES